MVCPARSSRPLPTCTVRSRGRCSNPIPVIRLPANPNCDTRKRQAFRCVALSIPAAEAREGGVALVADRSRLCSFDPHAPPPTRSPFRDAGGLPPQGSTHGSRRCDQAWSARFPRSPPLPHGRGARGSNSDTVIGLLPRLDRATRQQPVSHSVAPSVPAAEARVRGVVPAADRSRAGSFESRELASPPTCSPCRDAGGPSLFSRTMGKRGVPRSVTPN